MPQTPFERRPSSEAAQFTLPLWTDWPPNVWQPLVEAMSTWNAKLWTSAAAANGEYMDFLKRRTKADLAFAQTLANCKSPADVWRTYSDFLINAANDYRSEFDQLTSQWNAVTADSAAALLACTSGLQGERDRTQLAA